MLLPLVLVVLLHLVLFGGAAFTSSFWVVWLSLSFLVRCSLAFFFCLPLPPLGGAASRNVNQITPRQMKNQIILKGEVVGAVFPR